MIASVMQALPMKMPIGMPIHVDITDHAGHRVWRSVVAVLSTPCCLSLAKRHLDR